MKIESLVRGAPGHPSHPPLTDATIGIYTFATAAAVLSKIGISEHNFAAAWWLALVVGLIATTATAATGLLDWLTIASGTPLKRTATTHGLTMVTATVCFLLAAVVGHGGYVDDAVTTGAFVLTLVAFGLLALGGFFGGSIVYVHGMRVLNLVDEPSRRAVSPLPTPENREAAKPP